MEVLFQMLKEAKYDLTSSRVTTYVEVGVLLHFRQQISLKFFVFAETSIHHQGNLKAFWTMISGCTFELLRTQ